MSPAPNALTEKIRAKFPGVYDDLSDLELTKKILTKYPDYGDLVPEIAASMNPPKEPLPKSPLNYKGAKEKYITPAENFAMEQLPVAGMIAGGSLGSVEPGGGTIAGATLGAMAGESLKQGLQKRRDLLATAKAGASGAAAEMGGQIIGKGIEVGAPILKRGAQGLGNKAVRLSDLLTGTKGAVEEAEAARVAELAKQQEAIRARGIGVRQNVAKYQGAQEDLAAANAAKQSEYEAKLAAAKAKMQPAIPGEQQEWIDLNKSVQVGTKDLKVRLKQGATDFAEVTQNPGRGMAEEGLKSEDMAKLDPRQQREVLDPIITKAGKEVQGVVDTATKAGKKVNLYPLDESIDALADPKDRDATRTIVNRIGKSIGIRDWGNVTPSQALELRQELYKVGGDNAEYASRSVTRQLREDVPESAISDRHYTDLAGARQANERQIAKFHAGQWHPPVMEPKLPEAPTPKEFKHPAYKGLAKVPETPAQVDVSGIRRQQLKKTAKRAAIAAGTLGLYEAGKGVLLRSLSGNQ